MSPVQATIRLSGGRNRGKKEKETRGIPWVESTLVERARVRSRSRASPSFPWEEVADNRCISRACLDELAPSVRREFPCLGIFRRSSIGRAPSQMILGSVGSILLFANSYHLHTAVISNNASCFYPLRRRVSEDSCGGVPSFSEAVHREVACPGRAFLMMR